MGVMIDLKPGEQLFLGDGFIVNRSQRTRIYVEGRLPILREKESLSEEEADTRTKKVYLTLQQMYLASDSSDCRAYFSKARELAAGSADLLSCMESINASATKRDIYKAMKRVRRLAESEVTQ